MTAPYQNITYYCACCGKQIGGAFGQSCTCPPLVQTPPVPQYGWVCPLCGRGNSPFNLSCDCTAVRIYGGRSYDPEKDGSLTTGATDGQ